MCIWSVCSVVLVGKAKVGVVQLCHRVVGGVIVPRFSLSNWAFKLANKNCAASLLMVVSPILAHLNDKGEFYTEVPQLTLFFYRICRYTFAVWMCVYACRCVNRFWYLSRWQGRFSLFRRWCKEAVWMLVLAVQVAWYTIFFLHQILQKYWVIAHSNSGGSILRGTYHTSFTVLM